MTFQPFGRPFDLDTSLAPAEVKTAIRSRLKGWFEVKSGARGWIAGSFICLWSSAFNQQGPMLIGIISRDAHGTRIRGRAGSDLNGSLWVSMCCLALLCLVAAEIVWGDRQGLSQILPVTILFLIFMPIVLWLKHLYRREAEPLVRFLRDCIGRETKRQAKARTPAFSSDLELTADAGPLPSPVTPGAIYDALLDIGTDDILILSTAPEHYIQTVGLDGGYRVERRTGSADQHFEANRGGGEDDRRPAVNVLDFDEAQALFLAYATRVADPPFVRWTKMNFGS